MNKFERVPKHQLRNSLNENPKKFCNCVKCKQIKQRKNKIFGCFFKKLFTKKVLSENEKLFLLKEFN